MWELTIVFGGHMKLIILEWSICRTYDNIWIYSDCNVLAYITFCHCEMSFWSCKDHQSQNSRNYIVFLHVSRQSISAEQAKRFTKFRERKGLIDKDVVPKDRPYLSQWSSLNLFFVLEFLFLTSLCLCNCFKVRTDRSLSFYEGDDNPNVNVLRDILLTYSFYNFDLGYCQVVTPNIIIDWMCHIKNDFRVYWCV